MKIYNEITSRFNELTGQWETISEDSFNYSGPLDLAQGAPPNSSPINTSDTIADTIKTTTGYFTGGDGTLSGFECNTGSFSSNSSKYYVNVANNPVTSGSKLTEDQFSVTFGHQSGKGSDTTGDSSGNVTTLKGETEAIYDQLSELLQEPTIASGGFKISQQGSAGAVSSGNPDEYVYALIGKRSRFKDRMNKRVWTLSLGGITHSAAALSPGVTGVKLKLTDDSKFNAPVATPGGPRYNIVSGTLGVPTGSSEDNYLHKTYGWYYPEMGIMLFSGPQLADFLPGRSEGSSLIAEPGDVVGETAPTFVSCSGFTPNLSQTTNAKNHIRLLNCMRQAGSSTTLRLRSEEDATEENYFCRIKAEEYNFSSNHTFVSGSKNKIRAANMHGNPQTFITGVGLYNSAGQLLAIAKLSKPLLKNFATEATIKVKLTY